MAEKMNQKTQHPRLPQPSSSEAFQQKSDGHCSRRKKVCCYRSKVWRQLQSTRSASVRDIRASTTVCLPLPAAEWNNNRHPHDSFGGWLQFDLQSKLKKAIIWPTNILQRLVQHGEESKSETIPSMMDIVLMDSFSITFCSKFILATWASFSAWITAFFRSVSASFSTTFWYSRAINNFVFSASLRLRKLQQVKFVRIDTMLSLHEYSRNVINYTSSQFFRMVSGIFGLVTRTL